MEWEPLFDVGCITGRAMNISEEAFIERFPAPEHLRWRKGSLHVHTSESDGDASPAEVVRWYRRHGYHFVCITDHNRVTPVDSLNREFGKEDRFLVIPGEEITDNYPAPPGEGPVHITAIGVSGSIQPQGGPDATSVLRNDTAAVLTAGGLPMINHPNFRWSLTADDLFPVPGLSLLEFQNRGATTNNLGFDRPDPEELWDDLLSRGRRVYGVASDDAHHFTAFSPRHDNPGRGWVMVRSASLSIDSLLNALVAGHFYSTTGIILEDMETSPDRLKITAQRWEYERHRIEFIGLGGGILKTVYSREAEYIPNGAEGYVRIRVTDSNGLQAWTQPVFLAI